MDTKYGSDLDQCTDCGRLLNDLEGWRCGPCTAKHLNEMEAQAMTWYDPSDAELERRDALTARFWQHGWSAILFPLLCLVIAGTCLWGQNAHAQDTTLRAPHAINGRIYEWPDIGTAAYSASCDVYQAWEDGSARAYCAEDGASYSFDPEDNTWTPMISTR